MAANKLSCLFLGSSANFSDHDNRGGPGVLFEQSEHIHKRGTYDRVTAYANRRRLAHSEFGNLMNRLVGQGAAPRHDADMTGRMDASRHNTQLALSRRNDARAIGPDQSGWFVPQVFVGPNHIQYRYTLGYANDQRNGRVRSFHYCIGRECRRDVDYRSVRTGISNGIRDRVEHRNSLMFGAALSWSNSGDYPGAISNHLSGVK